MVWISFKRKDHEAVKKEVGRYGKCSKILKTFLFLFSNKTLVFRAGICKIVVKIVIREYPDQTFSLEAV